MPFLGLRIYVQFIDVECVGNEKRSEMAIACLDQQVLAVTRPANCESPIPFATALIRRLSLSTLLERPTT
jgi:hypothetical protein